MKRFHAKITRRTALLTGILTPAAAFSAWKVQEYSADPSGEKVVEQLEPPWANDGPLVAQTTRPAPDARLPWVQTGGSINDASHINQTPIYGIVQVRREDDIRQALHFAQGNGLKVALAGVRHSMGGQAFYKDAVILDMTQFNQVTLDETTRTITVQSGATWHAIQNVLHPRYAVKAMQSTDIFTVGGSIAVNAHGMDHRVGAIGRTIRSLRLMLADGALQTLSPSEQPELFALVIGGYGLFGVIVDAVLEITENSIYHPGRRVIATADFPTLFENELLPEPKLGLMYGHLSTAPQSLLEEMILYTYIAQDVPDAQIPPLGEVGSVKLRRFVLNFAKQGAWPMRLKWFAEKHIEPRMEACTVTRNQAMKDGETCLVARNEPMHDSVKYLQNSLAGETDILHEYFIPRAQLLAFVDGLRRIVIDHSVNLLNASVRVVHQEQNFLTYASVDAFSVVLYINQKTDQAGHAKMRTVTSALIDLTIRLGGRFFLPYQLHYTAEQLEQAYPEIRAFFAAKRTYDPQQLFTNTFYEKYSVVI
jgi:FAD/FMN-containing dehydrogenase